MLSTTPLFLTPPLQETPANIRINLTLPEFLTYIFAANSMALSSFKFSCWSPKNTYFEKVLRSSKVIDFGTNRKRVCNFLLVINSNLGPILHRFCQMATYWPKKH